MLKLSGISFVIMGIATILLRSSINWCFPSSQNGFLVTQKPGSWFWIGLAGCCVGSYVALATDYISWGLMTWVRQETGHQATAEKWIRKIK